jgi:putative peptide zinc metalloprotease protein
LVRLDGHTTVEEAWRRRLELDPAHTPGQQEVVQLLAQLHGAGLLSGELSADGTATFKRLQQRRRREVTAKWTNFLFVRFPLFDPQRVLGAASPLIRLLFNRWTGVLWVAALVVGMVALFGQSERFFAQTQGVLAPGNLLWLYLAWAILKLLHEFAHGAAVQAWRAFRQLLQRKYQL